MRGRARGALGFVALGVVIGTGVGALALWRPELSTWWPISVAAVSLTAIAMAWFLVVGPAVNGRRDDLTGLAARSEFRQAIDAALAAAPVVGPAVLLMDLDRFRDINETLGHRAGDLVIEAIGPRLLAASPLGSTVGRLGGDEFGVVLPRVVGVTEAMSVAEQLLRAVRAPIDIAGFELEVGASVGIALAPGDGDHADVLLQRSEIAMFAAKEERLPILTYAPELDHSSAVRLMLATELRHAIGSGEIHVYYQPKVDIERGTVVGAEALARWLHPVHGVIGPDEFIGVAERTGLIGDLTTYVLRQALAEWRVWHAAGVDLSVSVNVSARSVRDLDLPDVVTSLLAESGVEPDRLILEITETAIMADPDLARSRLGRLRSLGVRISLDDYGTGVASLAQLKRLPLDELKIDRSFITHMTSGSSDAVIAASTIDLAHRLGFAVVAEGIETVEVVDQLRQLGCGIGQGYLYSRPLTADEYLSWLLARRATYGPASVPSSPLPRPALRAIPISTA